MALSASSLESLILDNLEAQGIKTTGQYAQSHKMAKAIASAVIGHITANAQVSIPGGSSAGSYKVT